MGQEIVVIIGVGGMGATLARRQGAGKRLWLADFNAQALEHTAQSLREEGFDVSAHVLDVSSRESVARFAAEAAEAGPITQIIHTAGVSPAQASAAAILNVDVLGVAHVLDEFGAVVAPGGAGVVIASMAGAMAQGRLPVEMEASLALTPTADLMALALWDEALLADAGSAYSVAKRSNQLRVQAASPVWGKRGARVNSISPGVIATPMGRHELATENGERMRAMVASSGTGRVGTTSDIAAAASFLLGSDSAFITGTDLLVDGGVVAAVRSGARPST